MKSNQIIRTPDGVYDYLPQETALQNSLQESILKEFSAWGYQRAETPLLEYYDLYTSAGLNTEEELFKLVDSRGRLLALRPDITTSIARMAASKMSGQPLPLRISYAGDVFRFGVKEAKQMTQHTQIGIELLGDNTDSADAEVIALAIAAFQRIGLNNFQIEIGQVAFFKGLMKEAGLDSETAESVRQLVEQKNMLGIEMLLRDMPGNKKLHRIIAKLPYLYGGAEILEQAKNLTEQPECTRAIDKLMALYRTLRAFGLADFVTFDLGMVPSLDYYTGIIFRGIHSGMGMPLLNGGRYDGLLQTFGAAMPAVGFAIELSSLCEAIDIAGIAFPAPDAPRVLGYLPGAEQAAFHCAGQWRSAGRRVILFCGSKSEIKDFALARGADAWMLSEDGLPQELQ